MFVFRTNMNEMNVEPIDRGNKIRQSVDLRLAFAPIVLVLPILRERLRRCQLHALRSIPNLFAIGPLCCGEALAQVGQLYVRSFEMKRKNVGHVVLLLTT